jgi:hypothetical protein
MKYSYLLAPVVCVLLAPTVSVAQNSTSFNIVTSNAEADNPGNIYAVDVNNDGLTDIVEDSGYSNNSSFYVSINKGNGTFAAPVEYTLPVNDYEAMCIAPADYNNDGKVDLAVPLAGTNQIAVYLGSGDGTFQSPTISTVNFPNSGYTFDGQSGCAAGDFNADGAIDFAAWTNGGLYVTQGEGNGSFAATPYLALANAFPSLSGVYVGDYNGDGKADLGVPTQNDNNGTTIDVLYGNNDFTFNVTTPYTYNGLLWVGSGDLNGDGITDLYAITNYSPTPQQLGVFYGTAEGTFNSYWIDTPAGYSIGAGSAAPPWTSQLIMADFNGDGRMDLAAAASNSSGEDIEFFLAGANPGEFTAQAVAFPAESPWLTAPVAGLLSGGYLKPDVTLNQSNQGSDDTTPTTLPALLNTTKGLFGICPYPKSGKGFNVCAPGLAYGDTALFSVAADSFGKLRKIELWVDGAKVQEQDNAWDTHAYFDWAGRFSNGTHKAAFYAYDVDTTVQRYNFTFNVGGRH